MPSQQTFCAPKVRHPAPWRTSTSTHSRAARHDYPAESSKQVERQRGTTCASCLAIEVAMWSHGCSSMRLSRRRHGCFETAAFFGSRRILIHKIRDMTRTCIPRRTRCDAACIGSYRLQLLGRKKGQVDVAHYGPEGSTEFACLFRRQGGWKSGM